MLYYKKESGFSIVDLMITIAIIGAISLASVPSLKSWARNYNMQSAAMDLYAHMQIAKLGAVKENKSWTINFNPAGLLGYQVRNSTGKAVKTVDFSKQYNGEIQYGDPTTTKTYDAASIAFNRKRSRGKPVENQRLNFLAFAHRLY
jgi:Tfp pilus assembly protein FimT